MARRSPGRAIPLILATPLAAGLLGCGDASPRTPGGPRHPATLPATPAASPSVTPTPDTRWVCGGGQTSAERTFTVLCGEGSGGYEDRWVVVEGEDEVYLGQHYWCTQAITDIEVDELAGTPDLVHIKWMVDGSACYVGVQYAYDVFAQGAASTTLLRGSGTHISGGHSYPRQSGSYDLGHGDAALSITERLLDLEHGRSDEDPDGYCRATEMRLARRYATAAPSATLLACSKSRREASFSSATPVSCSPRIDDLLAAAPWEPVEMSPEESESHCRAIGGGL
jgi:hypothetical protein